MLFVGANEIQARYDARIAEELRARWPGVEVRFEHTAWTSNRGREYDRLRWMAAQSDAVVLMVMMRTMLGRKLRDALSQLEEAAPVAVRICGNGGGCTARPG